MNYVIKILAVLVVAGAGAGCLNKEQAGTLLGAAGGAAIGSQIGGGTGRVVATAAGALFGGMLGQSIGRDLDRVDRLAAARAQDRAYTAPMGSRVTWSNPENGHAGSVTPVREGTDRATGAYCREFQQTVTIGGREQQAYGTACRQPDGSWQIQENG